MICDAHVHFFSERFFALLGAQVGQTRPNETAPGADDVVARVGWEPPGAPGALADRWIGEFDRHGVGRAAIIASLPGDEPSVVDAAQRHPARLVGFFMVNPLAADCLERVRVALDAGLRGICLFPAMHRYSLQDDRVMQIFQAAAEHGGNPAVFVHCGVLSVGVRKKLGLPSPFEYRFGNPLDLQAAINAHPAVPVIVPHFGAGFFREALMLAEGCSNVHLDTSSSNGWMRYIPGLTLEQVFRTAVDVVGAERLLFGTDSSFFPRGWHKAVYDAQLKALGDARIAPDARAQILGGNFQRLFPVDHGHQVAGERG